MSFPIVFYRNLSPTNAINKNLDEVSTVEGTLRTGASLLDPVLLIEANAPGFHANKINYFYVEQFGRYYYITNIISKNHTLWEIHSHVDVLMSYREEILEQTAVVARQEAKYNLMLDDGIFMSYQNPKIQTKLFSVEGPFEHQEFVLIVAGS